MGRHLLSLLLASTATGQDLILDTLKQAIQATGEEGYGYRIRGRFDREGEVLPGEILTSRMKIYQSARHGDRVLIKGPEGLWRTPQERLGEKTEKIDPEAVDIVRTLEGAETPHRILETMLSEVDHGREPEEREVDGVACRRYVLYFRAPELKRALERLIERAVEKRTLTRPDEIRWSSSARGLLRIYLDQKRGRLVRAVVEQSVKIAYKVADQQPEVKTYRADMEFDFLDVGGAKLQLPREIQERLSIKGE